MNLQQNILMIFIHLLILTFHSIYSYHLILYLNNDMLSLFIMLLYYMQIIIYFKFM